MKKSISLEEYRTLSDAARTSLSAWMASHGVVAFSVLSHGVLLVYLQEHFGDSLWRLECEEGEWCVWSKATLNGYCVLLDGRWFTDPLDALWHTVCLLVESQVQG